jgi:hypothetical protein
VGSDDPHPVRFGHRLQKALASCCWLFEHLRFPSQSFLQLRCADNKCVRHLFQRLYGMSDSNKGSLIIGLWGAGWNAGERYKLNS